jgi:NAD(P)-dependent dehydrogenase (short-subunit alcohol dehydrogenase family)
MSERPVAFVTGASRGIGRGIALALARDGFDIVGNATAFDPDRRDMGLAEVKERVEAAGAAFAPAPGNVADLAGHPALLATALDRFGRVDVLVNNAGVAPEVRRDLLETTPESYDRVLGINTRGPFFLSQRFARYFRDRVAAEAESDPAPSIIFVTSISAEVSSPSRAEYCLSKAALSQAARIFADRLATEGVRVFEVRPGLIRTDMTAAVTEKYEKLIHEGLVPQGRWGTPEDVGRAVSALARGEFAYSTGQVVTVGGGMQIQRL